MKKIKSKELFDYAFFMCAKTPEEAMRHTNVEPMIVRWSDTEAVYSWEGLNKTIHVCE